MDLTILLCHGTDLPARAIEAAEHDPVSHIAIDTGDGDAVEAYWYGLRLMPADRYATARRYPLALTPEQAAAGRAWLRDRVGIEGYDFLQLPDDLAAILTHHRIVSPFAPHRLVCSAVAAELCRVLGVYPFGAIPPAAVRPDDWDRLANDAGRPHDLGALLTGAPAVKGATP